jgi:hypothetical protein
VSLSLSDIALPSVSSTTSSASSASSSSNAGGLVNSLDSNNESSTRDAEGANTGSNNDPLEVADLGRGGGSGLDPFSQNFQLVGSGGAFGGNDYFTASIFDFAANKSKSGNKDDDRR